MSAHTPTTRPFAACGPQWPYAVVQTNVPPEGRTLARYPVRREAVSYAAFLNSHYPHNTYLALNPDGLPGKEG